ncbi:SGNH/GDSL hydrolase family protein [Planococcus halocryophilus]|uniref:SGNH/GDSL hydrolase family protein n=1 Tax=Planococcus halocryophilus TaxID=1215089 RepID=UPI000B277406|nr:GDSL-type esterase/lipase family protein [Planococcus halocryophilus]
MNKLLKVFIAFFLVLSLGTPSVFAENSQGKDSLVALGDSVPFGYNLSEYNNHPAKNAYPYLISDEADLRVRNLGVPGWQTSDLLAAIKTNKKYQQAILHADYVTITIGGNDFLEILRTANAESGGNPQLFQQLIQQKLFTSQAFGNLTASIEEIRKLTDSPIVLYNAYNPFQLNNPLHHISNLFLPQVNAAFTGIAYSYSDVRVADAYRAFSNNQANYVIPQDIHPTIAGQEELAKIGLRALQFDYITR